MTQLQTPERKVFAVFRWVIRDSVRKAKREHYNIVELNFGERRETRIEPAGLALKPENTQNLNEEIYDDVRFYESAPSSYGHGTIA